MVIRLEGKINGESVIFKRKYGDEWETTVPKSLNGVYIVELTACDEAGNKGYAAKYLVTIDIKKMLVRLEKLPWGYKILEHPYCAESSISPYICKADCEGMNYFCDIESSEYYAVVME